MKKFASGEFGIEKEAPNSKHQIPNRIQWHKFQTDKTRKMFPILSVWRLGFIWDLALGIWDLSEIGA
jgi:hypothetical protein